ncbi:putative S-adenosylmethionine carrier 2, chloroplastic [Nannochloris sp. 'desiccata']|nr:putative S-adenosylmethionine carrier 2, chloroplastic [Chlorella desiccata (nom. nud.)]
MNTPWEGWLQSGRFEALIANPSSSERASTSRESNETETPALAGRSKFIPFAHVSQGIVTAATGAGLTLVLRRKLSMSSLKGTESASVTTVPPPPKSAPPPPPHTDGKPAHDVVAGAVARAASQSTIHPLDTMKVRMQASSATAKAKVAAPKGGSKAVRLERGLTEVRGLYKGVIGAATGAGIIIGTYFAFYSTTKRFLRENTEMHEGASAFVAGATAALGSSVVKVPLAVCIRSVQAGVYKNVFHAGKSIVNAAGVRGLFTGFLPTVLEDVPDMAVKFAVYESLRKLHINMRDGRPANIAEDLIMGGVAGAAAAAATTPLDVVKTVMMCTASSRPTLISAAKSIMREGKGMKPFFRGVGPRALSNGLNSAIFFCFFEAIRQVLIKKQDAAAAALLAEGIHPNNKRAAKKQELNAVPKVFGRSEENKSRLEQQQQREAAALRPAGTAAACLSLALPVDNWLSNSE